jgi:isopentenyl diphosphate isomerase/L-lactate dehydrogenase-like FMN-dependent dehydrogenase
LTVDATVDGYREEDIINNFQFPIPMPNLEKYSAGDGKGKGIGEIMPLLLKRSVKTMFVELPNTPICQSSSKGFSLLKMLCAQLVPVQPRFMFPTMAAVS